MTILNRITGKTAKLEREQQEQRFQAEAEARGDTDSIKSCNATIASLATSAATLEPENSIVQGMIETVANAVLATHANMAPLIVNTVTIPGVTVDDVDDQREALRLKGRGAHALGYRANECPPSVDMCDETHLASPITHHPRILCHGCGYLSSDCHCSPHWVTSATSEPIINIQEQYGNRVWRSQPRFAPTYRPIPAPSELLRLLLAISIC